MSSVYIATKTALVNIDGQTVKIRRQATRVSEDSPLLAAFPQYFKEADVNFEIENTRQKPSRGARAKKPR